MRICMNCVSVFTVRVSILEADGGGEEEGEGKERGEMFDRGGCNIFLRRDRRRGDVGGER